ncbi:MAG TPA: FAD-binding protein [Streptosporangiaceae bacterium]
MTGRTGAQPRWPCDAEVVVVGSGAAGMAAAVTAAAHGRRVLLLSKDEIGGGSTPLAQGGMAAALDPDDSVELHAADTLVAGAGLCDPAAVAVLARSAPDVIGWLSSLGARFGYGHLEGGHSRRRVVHAGGDAIGAEVHRVLTAALLASGVRVLPHTVALDLTDGGLLVGSRAPGSSLVVGEVRARAVVLATGGFGQAFATTTNPAGVTGDGLALAFRAGAELRDVEFMQFHPTVLWSAGSAGQCPLITEALRGAGAVVLDDLGHPAVPDNLAPRDVVSAGMQAKMTSRGAAHLWLDATSVSRLEERFPTVTAACREHGIDPVTDWIPVAPGAHYACGGVRASMSGQTSLPGVFAVGEVARTGVHGANRLASNSLTEAITMGRRVGELLGRELPPGVRPAGGVRPAAGSDGWTGIAASARSALAAAMSRYAGVQRDREGLEHLLAILRQAPESTALDMATVEATNLHTVSALVATAALDRTESRGCHRRADFPVVTGAAA